MNLNGVDDRMDVGYADESCYESGGGARRHRCCVHDEIRESSPGLVEETSKKSRRYQKNKDADRARNYRKSYPVGCKCEKYKKVKDEAKSTSRRKLIRSVSFASYDDSMTSSIYDDGESSSDSSAVVLPKHESYKDFKQRKMQEKYASRGRDRSPKWNEIKKAKSASNIRDRDVPPSRNKRLIDSHEHSCSDRSRNCVKSHKSKYRKLDDCSKVASAGCSALVRCRSANTYQEQEQCVSHSKSFDSCARKYDKHESSRRFVRIMVTDMYTNSMSMEISHESANTRH